MRHSHALLVLPVLAACSNGPSRTAPPEPGPVEEVPRAVVELLVQRFAVGEPTGWYTMAPDGSGVRPFDGIPPEVVAAVPSPDGRTIALLREAGDDVHLWLLDRLGRTLTPVLTGVRVVHAVSWSPDGARLAVAQSTDAVTEDVFVLARDGSGAVDLTPDPLPAVSFDRLPAWSPDGTTIAFASNRSGTTRLWLMDPDGGNPRAPLAAALTDARERSPAWSQDGAWIGFLADRLGPGGIEGGVGVVRADGPGYRFLPAEGPLSGLSWSPDGRLLYASPRSANWEVYAVDVATGETENLTRHLFQDLAARPLRWVPPPAWAGFGPAVRHDLAAAGALGAGDLDGDGDLDLVALAPAVASARILRNVGGGTFEKLGGLDTLEGPLTLAVSDFDRDGFDDLAVGGAGAFQLFRGGAGGPGLPLARTLAGELRTLGTADFGIDGATELAALVRNGATAPFRAQLHGVNAEADLLFLVDAPVDFAGAAAGCAADATGEGWPDLVVLLAGPGASVAVVPGFGPSFGAPFGAATGLGLDDSAVPACADLDGDRRADLAILRPGVPSGLTIHLGGEAGFGAPATLPVAGADLAAADLDRDGDPDLVVADPAGGGLRWLRNLGDGTFAPPSAIESGGAPSRVLAADLDGDGWTDLAVVDADGAVGVVRNRGFST